MATTIISPVAEKTFQVLDEKWRARETQQALLIVAFGARNDTPLTPKGVSVRLGGGRYRYSGSKPHVHIEGAHRRHGRYPFRRVVGKVENLRDEAGEIKTYIIIPLEEVRAKAAELAVQDAEIVAADKRSSDAYAARRNREETLKKKLGVAKERSWTTEPEYEIPGISDISADYEEKGTFSVKLEGFSGLTEEEIAELVVLLGEFRAKVVIKRGGE